MSNGFDAQRDRRIIVGAFIFMPLWAPLFVGLLGVGIETLSLIWE